MDFHQTFTGKQLVVRLVDPIYKITGGLSYIFLQTILDGNGITGLPGVYKCFGSYFSSQVNDLVYKDFDVI